MADSDAYICPACLSGDCDQDADACQARRWCSCCGSG